MMLDEQIREIGTLPLNRSSKLMMMLLAAASGPLSIRGIISGLAMHPRDRKAVYRGLDYPVMRGLVVKEHFGRRTVYSLAHHASTTPETEKQ